jgi:hypothetical protein
MSKIQRRYMGHELVDLGILGDLDKDFCGHGNFWLQGNSCSQQESSCAVAPLKTGDNRVQHAWNLFL